MKKTGSSNIKYIVIIGYVLVVAIMVVGLITIYNTLVDFSEKKIKQEDLSELLIVGNTLSKLYEIESGQNLFDAESARSYFHTYDSIVPIIKLNLDSLQQMTSDEVRINKLDSIKLLIGKKNENLKEVAVLLDSIRKAPRITRETVSGFVPKKLNKEITDYLESKNLNTPEKPQNDTSVVYGERRGFLSRVRDVFVARSDSTILVEKKTVIQEEDFKLMVDTVVNMVRYSERIDLERQKVFQYALLQRQAVMSNTNSLLTARIDELLKGIEQEELNKSVQLLMDKELALSRSQRTLYLVLWMAVIIAAVFGLLFLSDVNRSQRYRRKLEASNKRISELLAAREKLMLTISHDIKAPMSSIIGYIELMESDMDKKKKDVYLENMKNSSDHVLQLVSTLLDYHKLEAGTWVLKETNFNLRGLVDETAASFQPLAARKNLKYTVENRLPKTQLCFGDPYVIRQIMSNIISNAIKYTTTGSVRVTAETTPDFRFIFSVKDTGAGIDKNDQQHIFREFHQLTSANSDAYIEGSGLGLAITKGFVEELNGAIRLDSQKGKGSEFVVELPLKSKQKAETSGFVTQTKKEYDLQGISVLVVDDDPIQLLMTSEMLEIKKAEVVTEPNPEKVLEILKKKSFDIIFVDIQMPRMNGFALADKIRKSDNSRLKEVPIIALSAKSDLSESTVQASLMTDFLTKPFTSERLYETVCRYAKSQKTPTPELQSVPTNPNGVAALVEFVKDDKTVSVEILQTFVAETNDNIAGLENAFRQKDITRASELSHKMLPLFRMMGDATLVSLMEQTEQKQAVSTEDEMCIVSSVRQYIADAEAMMFNLQQNR